MTIHVRGDWCYDHDVNPYEAGFIWHVVRFQIDPRRPTQVTMGTWIAGGIAATREEAEREGMAAINADEKTPRKG